MSKPEIETVLRELNKITGLRVSLHDADYREIAAYPEKPLPFCSEVNSIPTEHERCMECDRSACEKAVMAGDTVIYKCRYGLTESVSPLYNFGELTGFLMMGQIAEGERERVGASKTLKSGFGIDCNADLIPIVGKDMIASYSKIMSICAKYLTLANATSSKRAPIVTRATVYIKEHLSEKIVIKDICLALGCSKTTLLTSFKSETGTTLNEYLTKERLKEAEKLLRTTDMSAAKIAEATGFSDQSYFSKVFSAKYGVSPTRYKAHFKNNC